VLARKTKTNCFVKVHLAHLQALLQNTNKICEGGAVMSKPFDRIAVNPDVCMGQPTIRGIRITVAFVLKLLASGMSHQEILIAYPELEENDIRQAIEYAAWLAGEYHRPTPVYAE
jgi:uncharacterized protein (DUF433 family)